MLVSNGNDSLEAPGSARSCAFGSEGFEAIAEQLGKFNRTLQTIEYVGVNASPLLCLCDPDPSSSLQDHPDARSHGYQALVHCVSINPTLLKVAVSASTKYDKLVQKLERLLAVNAMLTKLRTVRPAPLLNGVAGSLAADSVLSPLELRGVQL